jgi:antitoxin FitA
MLTVKIDNDAIEARLRERAAANGHSPEDEARDVLGTALLARTALPDQNLGQALHEEFAKLGGVELDLDWLRKLPDREPPTFD